MEEIVYNDYHQRLKGDIMAILYAKDLPQRKASRYAVVDIADLLLDAANPRFASSSLLSRENEISQRDIINYLVEYGEASKLAEEIEQHNGLFGEDIMSACIIDGKVVVLEGNRRLAACKLLLDNSVLDERLAGLYPVPSLSEATRANIEKILLLIYDDSADAQTYIASKHTQPNIKKWTTIEQYNYYYSQFKRGKSTTQIAEAVRVVGATEVEKRIKEYALFDAIFGLVKKKHPDLQVEAASILPVVTAFMPKLLGKNKKYTLLGVEFDRKKLSYVSLPSQKALYEEILCLIGEAFFARPEAKKQAEKEKRANDARFRISSDEIKGANKVETLIDEDKRIPGLKQLILKFRDEELTEEVDDGHTAGTIHREDTESEQSDSGASNTKNEYSDGSKDNAETDAGGTKLSSFASKEKQVLFFADFRYEHLDPTNNDNKGLIAVAKEIKNLSAANGYTGYHKFPIAASFLLRSLIEQTLLRHLKGTTVYARMSSNTSKATPELEKMVGEVLKACQNSNYQLINVDKKLGDDFVACFAGGGTKHQLNKIIHSPAECQPNKEFLDSMANGGLKCLLQKFVDAFT